MIRSIPPRWPRPHALATLPGRTALAPINRRTEDLPMAAAPLHLLNVEDGIAVVTLNRPEALNSMNKALRLELLELWPALDMRQDVKVIVVTGAGDKAFCTGADLKERS